MAIRQLTRSSADGDETFSFSFSGLKTAVMRAVQSPPASGKRTRGVESMDPASSNQGEYQRRRGEFPAAAVDMLVDKTIQSGTGIQRDGDPDGGRRQREPTAPAEMERHSKLPVYSPPLKLCTDNAAMIAAAGIFPLSRRAARGSSSLDATPMLSLTAADFHE